MKFKVKYLMHMILVFMIFSMGCSQKKSENDKKIAAHLNKPHKIPLTDPDKTLLIGEWSIIGAPWMIKINDVLDTGKLDAAVYNTYSPTKIEIELANWTKIGNLLSIYVEIKDPDYPGFSFKLNYIPERDVLVGTIYDSISTEIYTAEFKRDK